MDIPDTEQGLITFITYAKAEITRSEKKIRKLHEIMSECKDKLENLKEKNANSSRAGDNS